MGTASPAAPDDDVNNVDFRQSEEFDVPVLDGGKVVGIVSLLDAGHVWRATKDTGMLCIHE